MQVIAVLATIKKILTICYTKAHHPFRNRLFNKTTPKTIHYVGRLQLPKWNMRKQGNKEKGEIIENIMDKNNLWLYNNKTNIWLHPATASYLTIDQTLYDSTTYLHYSCTKIHRPKEHFVYEKKMCIYLHLAKGLYSLIDLSQCDPVTNMDYLWTKTW